MRFEGESCWERAADCDPGTGNPEEGEGVEQQGEFFLKDEIRNSKTQRATSII